MHSSCSWTVGAVKSFMLSTYLSAVLKTASFVPKHMESNKIVIEKMSTANFVLGI